MRKTRTARREPSHQLVNAGPLFGSSLGTAVGLVCYHWAPQLVDRNPWAPHSPGQRSFAIGVYRVTGAVIFVLAVFVLIVTVAKGF